MQREYYETICLYSVLCICVSSGGDYVAAPRYGAQCRRKFSSARHADRFARILHNFVGSLGELDSSPVILARKNDMKSALFQHSGERTRSLADRQLLRRIVPIKTNRR